jgi:hypothetical protein
MQCLGYEFAVTAAGSSRLQSVEMSLVPADPSRYVALLEKESDFLGKGRSRSGVVP